MKDKNWFLFYLNQVTGANVPLFELITSRYQNAEELYELAKKRDEVALKPLGQAAMSKLIECADESLIDTRIEWLKKRNIHIIPLESDEYPDLLREIKNPPSMLYVKGKLAADMELPIAIIGMRRHTAYGEAVANHIAAELVKHGATIISGMALGIDACAARAALGVNEAVCPTVAVLGSGIDVVYPPENARLYDEIAERGAVISEFLPGTKPYRDHFPVRNRIISGMAKGVVVVEAGSRSGTTITAGHALDQGRDVYAVPGRITDESSLGPNRMIQRGEAKPVFCAADILLEYGIDIFEKPKNDNHAARTKKAERAKKKERESARTETLPELLPLERQIVEQLKQGRKNADELCDLLSIDAATLNSSLTSLQFSGIIKQLPGRLFGL